MLIHQHHREPARSNTQPTGMTTQHAMSCWGFFFSLFPSKATKKQTIKNIWNYADHYTTLFFWVISCANHTKAQVWCWYTLEAFEDKLWSGLLKLFWRWMWPYSKCIKHKHKCISYAHTTALWVEIQLAVKNGCRKRKVEEENKKHDRRWERCFLYWDS